ncbi:bifunctional indole-3-glycerol-phosphate synthase TrpC/phosphoribosylanthranilate isomerase TrpF [Providencia stuartii]|uniref:bifunctional indole-3-glycerol-phosphate synthase TrpC/phosphoribosylanthranilate isomerase TrpF n=1 Tax=Providencia stuartii TaxID=588 RepID=UPI0004F708AB|nr:bifunctional indole-3-glycerol-phosphate synthase TrpC/phosphoribosylanthranilate isomerase TrpF [Providencia stuartii]AIN62337.1 indole-3-glycerol phosphate synthase family protein [Providencia stuartii]MBG5896641.1 bifunctional indole-3-glycerol-phosphate synthase TrpC/phosphoribosylanthranilate isomerase TrpF [Providencia stuartii]MBK1421817.1 bifunctional indole-3-glycerol-phosphate synthase TrpC/phosphoribosylanthranilate isomerase TrpF [Providencia stuartii]MTC65645.1 bifunctional indo
MKATVLQKIVDDKLIYLEERKQQQPLDSFIDKVLPSSRRFYEALSAKRPVFILECKKASPSKGLIREDFDPAVIANIYAPYASAISVLTDEKYFQGNMAYLTTVSRTVKQPVLCKDFIVDPYQIYLARYYQGDAILLMLSVVSDEQYIALAEVAHQLNMGVLTEVSNEEELERAIKLKARVVGINNRDLRDLSIDLNRTRELAPRLPEGTIIISESGIHRHQHIQSLSQFANGFLIGSALMEQADLNKGLQKLLIGEHKVCGLTRSQDAQAALAAGATYGGLIFAENSPRKVTLSQARQIIHAAPLQYVGVFRDQSADFVAHMVEQLALSAVQLHGHEDADYVKNLRSHLPEHCEIWKAVNMSQPDFSQLDGQPIDLLLLDNGRGGSGQTFDWSKIPNSSQFRVMVAGGLNADNCRQAATLLCNGLDFNSGVETEPGIKSEKKLNQVFSSLAL